MCPRPDSVRVCVRLRVRLCACFRRLTWVWRSASVTLATRLSCGTASVQRRQRSSYARPVDTSPPTGRVTYRRCSGSRRCVIVVDVTRSWPASVYPTGARLTWRPADTTSTTAPSTYREPTTVRCEHLYSPKQAARQTEDTRKRSTHNNKITKVHTTVEHSPERLSTLWVASDLR